MPRRLQLSRRRDDLLEELVCVHLGQAPQELGRLILILSFRRRRRLGSSLASVVIVHG